MKYKQTSLFLIVLTVLLFTVAAPVTAAGIKNQLKASVRDYLVSRYPRFKNDEIVISFKHADQTLRKLEKLTGKLTFKVDPLYSKFNPLGSAVMPILIKQNGKAYQRAYLKSEIEVYKKLVVAVRKLKKYKILTAADLTYKKVNIANSSKRFFLKKEQLLGRQTKTIIRAGKPVFSWMIRVVPLFTRGDKIIISIKKGNVKVSAVGKALGDGYLGKKVKVKKLGSRREFVATVIGSREVEVF